MKNKITFAKRLFSIFLVAYLFLSNFNNPPNGYTGAPPNNNTCASTNGGCHFGGSGTGNISITGLPATITPNTQYPITVTVNRTNAIPELGGFQMVVLDANNNNSGVLSNPGASSTTQTSGGRTYFEHFPALSFGGNSVTYTVDWTAPATGSGMITMYAAANLADDNNSTSGDAVVTTTSSGNLMGGGVITVNVTGTNVSCFGGNNGTATASATGGGGPPYTYNWSNGASGPMITGLTAGPYTVTVTNGAGGQGTGSVTITQPSSPVSVSIVNSQNITCTNPVGQATAQGSGGTPGYTYNWSNGSSGPTANFTSGATYFVTVSDANNCTATTSVTIQENTTPPLSEAGPPMTIDCFNATAVLDGTGSSAGPNILYAWTTSDGNIISGANTPTPTVDAGGTYTLTVTDATNGCTAADNTTVAANTTPPTVNAGPNKEITCAVSSVELDGTGSSSGPNFDYLWTTINGNIVSGENTPTPTVNAPGTYTLTVTNTDNGCSDTDEAMVTNNTAMPVSSAGPDTTLTCAVTSLQLDGSGSSTGPNFSYQWTTTNGNIVSGSTTLMPTIDAPGTYCLEVTDIVNSCTATDCVNVDENTTAPIADAGSAAPLTCTVTTVALNGSASSSGPDIVYLWTTTDGNIVSGETTTMPEVDQTGTYTITVTDNANGCTASASVTVTANITPPVAEAGPPMALNCNNSSVVLNGSGSSQGGNITYLWDGPGIVSGGTTANPTVDAAGTYIITVTNTSNGCTASDSTTVTQTPPLEASISDSTNVDCNGANTGSATAAGTGGNGAYSFEWSNNATTAMISNAGAGTYTVTITDEDNCTATTSVTITEPDALIANASATGETSAGAMDGTATSDPAGGVPGYTYNWSNGETTQTITGLSAGNYTVTVTDDNNCTAVETVTVSSFNCASFGVEFEKADPLCNGSEDGEAAAIPLNGTWPFTFNWSNGSMDSVATGLGSGTYTVTITDANDCEITGNITLNDPASVTIEVVQKTNVACNGEATGSVSVEAGGGTPGYTYNWPGGNTGPAQENLEAGMYTVTVSDANGCTQTLNVNITQPPALTGMVSATDETSVGASNGTATVSVMGGVSPYEYEWNIGETTQTITGLPPGDYCVTVTDINGCTFSGCATVNQFGCGGTSVDVTGQNVTCFGGNDGQATATTAGFAPPVTFAWSNGGTGGTIGGLTADTYTVTVTDANNCTLTAEIKITQPDELVIEVDTVGNVDCPDDMNGLISVNVTGGTPGYAYIWPNGSTQPGIENLPAGLYEVTVSDDNDCSSTLEIEVGVKPDTIIPIVMANDLTVELDENGEVSITPGMVENGSTDNCGIDTFILNMDQFDCSFIGENEITLMGQDAAGNCGFAFFTLTVQDNLSPEITCPDDVEVNLGSGCEVVVEFDDATATDNCSAVTVVQTDGLSSGSGFPAGTHVISFEADDGNGNTATCSFNITVNGGLEASTAGIDPTCNGFDDGSASVAITGGQPPYTYLWDDPSGQTGQMATGLMAGVYMVTVTDASGCEFVASVELSEPPALEVTVDQVDPEVIDEMNGAVSITLTGGTGGYTFEWSLNGTLISTDEDPTGLEAGEYTLVATDDNGCTVETTVTVDLLISTTAAELDAYISLFPNPVSENVHLQFELPETADVKVAILDLSGRPVVQEVVASFSNQTITFDTHDYASGVYIVRMIVNETVLFRRVIVK